MQKTRGFTLVELLIVVAIIGVFALGLTGFFFTRCSSNSGSAEDEARKYAKSLGIEIKGVSCTDRDTDRDGYISCSLSLTENGKVSIIPIECAARWGLNSGCREQKQVIRRGLF